MGHLLSELKDNIHWEDTYKRMMDKENFDAMQVARIMELYRDGYHEDVIRRIEDGRFKWGKCEKRLLNKVGTHKKRTVYLYPLEDRYILGGMYRAFSEYFKDRVSGNVFSYKKGIRTLTAIDYLMGDKSLANKYGLKLDISAYFNSVSREYLGEILDELMEGQEEGLRACLEDMLFNDKVYFRGKEIAEYKSLVPGTPFSSFLANYCLKDIDTFIADGLGVTYARYSDDIIYFTDTEEELEIGLAKIKEKLLEVGLRINESKYERFKPGDEITYLGLKIKGDKIDISDNSARKFKKKIKHACVTGRREIEVNGRDPYKQATKILKRHNYRVYKCYIQDASKFGWGYYAFRYVTTMDTLRELDFYLRDRIRQMITGRNNSANIRKVPDEVLEELGYTSLCDMYRKFKEDFDMYCDEVDLIKT